MYSVYLEVWLQLFDRRDFLILRSEDYYADPGGVFKQVGSGEIPDGARGVCGCFCRACSTGAVQRYHADQAGMLRECIMTEDPSGAVALGPPS